MEGVLENTHININILKEASNSCVNITSILQTNVTLIEINKHIAMEMQK